MSILFTSEYVLVEPNRFDSRKRLVKLVGLNSTTGVPEYVSNLIRDIKPVNNMKFIVWGLNTGGGNFVESLASMEFVEHEGGSLVLKELGSKPVGGTYNQIFSGTANVSLSYEIANWDVGE